MVFHMLVPELQELYVGKGNLETAQSSLQRCTMDQTKGPAGKVLRPYDHFLLFQGVVVAIQGTYPGSNGDNPVSRRGMRFQIQTA